MPGRVKKGGPYDFPGIALWVRYTDDRVISHERGSQQSEPMSRKWVLEASQ